MIENLVKSSKLFLLSPRYCMEGTKNQVKVLKRVNTAEDPDVLVIKTRTSYNAANGKIK